MPPAPSPAVAPVVWFPPAAFALAAVALLIEVLGLLGDGVAGAALTLVPLIPALAVVAAFVAVAVGLVQGRPTARTGAAVLAPTLLLAVLAGGADSVLLVLTALLCLGAAVALVVVPDLRAHFRRAHFQGDRPGRHGPSVVVAGMLIGLFAGLSAAAAGLSLIFLVIGLVGFSAMSGSLGDADGSGVVAPLVGMLGGVVSGIALVWLVINGGLAVFGSWAQRACVRGENVARVLVTVLASLGTVVFLVATLAGGTYGVAMAFLCLHVALLVLLWVPNDARAHFRTGPLRWVENLRHQVADGGVPHAPRPGPQAWPTGGPPPGRPAPPRSATPQPAPPRSATRQWPGPPPTRHQQDTLAGPVSRPSAPRSLVARVCAGCGLAAEASWGHCPQCGAPLSPGP